ncbi:methyltransferase domain-containing protein [Nocardia arthritidis]|uniref:Methyltransferase domain-containing protein n=1 Tax=Nocardia arthritidis TaxID=228602 RepID=A0A6G9Y8J4_9NOCA|nr:methyltransferase domain-containing protein [Nocardia arthritidis]QIS09440.1 methyltransferase domain-containing protein [Nocardia arthritidis]
MTHPDTETLGEFIISARSLAEYRAIFGLTASELRGRILDCPGGAAGFTAEASDLGAQVIAVDPIYTRSVEDLRATALRECDRATRWAARHSHRRRWDWYGSPADHLRMRTASARRFGADLTEHPERYIGARLPSLPFPDKSFDLVLSSHLLFSYADRLDADFHLAALVELARVAVGETRIYPLVDHTGANLDPLVDKLRKELHDKGLQTELRDVDFEFHHGASTILVLR